MIHLENPYCLRNNEYGKVNVLSGIEGRNDIILSIRIVLAGDDKLRYDSDLITRYGKETYGSYLFFM